MTFEGAFQSFQTVLIPCSDSCGRRWLRARAASAAAPAPSPQPCGVPHLAAQVLPTTVNLLPLVLLSISSLGRAWIFLFCWAAPSRGRSFLVAIDRQPGVWFLLGLCVQTAASCAPTRYFSTWKRVQAEERPREWWQGQSQQCRAAGDTQPWLREGTARASSSSESLQGPPWH